jgi:hypothetical protein
VEHLEVVVITPHQRHKLGPAQRPRHLRVFLGEVHWRWFEAQIMVMAGIPREEIRHTRAVQDWLAATSSCVSRPQGPRVNQHDSLVPSQMCEGHGQHNCGGRALLPPDVH